MKGRDYVVHNSAYEDWDAWKQLSWICWSPAVRLMVIMMHVVCMF